MVCDISVIICTYNRAEILREALESWRSLENAGFNVELIIVDNNSTDHTPQVVESFRPACPGQLRYVCETNVGLSYARNRGIKEASGEIVAFVDDDVLFDKSWLNELLKAFNGRQEVSCVGGNSIPKFLTDQPGWITKDVFSVYGSTGSGDHDKLMIFPEHPFGLNMAFRKNVFAQVGDFNIQFGQNKKKFLIYNDEREMFYRISRAGLKVFYASKAILYHRIPKDRTTKNYLLKRYYWQGVSDVVFWQLIKPRTRFILFLKTIRSLIKILLPSGKSSPKNIYHYYKSFSFNDKLSIYQSLGTAKQNFAEILTVSK
jgi:glycosyltransferase involved in cell wall biosynthesis